MKRGVCTDSQEESFARNLAWVDCQVTEFRWMLQIHNWNRQNRWTFTSHWCRGQSSILARKTRGIGLKYSFSSLWKPMHLSLGIYMHLQDLKPMSLMIRKTKNVLPRFLKLKSIIFPTLNVFVREGCVRHASVEYIGHRNSRYRFNFFFDAIRPPDAIGFGCGDSILICHKLK